MKMCQAFTENGHEVTLYARKSTENCEDVYRYYGVKENFSINKNLWPNFRGVGGLVYGVLTAINIKRNNQADIYYGRDIYSLFMLSKFNNSAIYYESHKPPINKVSFILEKKLFSTDNFKQLIVITKALKEKYLEMFPNLPRKKIIVAPDGADVPKNFRLKNNKGVETKSVGYVGHLYPGKGMEIIEKLSKELPEINFHVIGGKKQDIDYWRKKLSNKNIIFHGYIPNGELEKYYEKLNIFLAPYQDKVSPAGGKGNISQWMSPLKIFEYMSYEKAIIASDLPVIKEILINNYNCLLCEPNNIEEWKKAIIYLINNPEKSERIRSQAYKDLEEKYTWKQRGKNVIS